MGKPLINSVTSPLVLRSVSGTIWLTTSYAEVPPAISLLRNTSRLIRSPVSRSKSIRATPFSPRNHCEAKKGELVKRKNSTFTRSNSTSVRRSPSNKAAFKRLRWFLKLSQRSASVFSSGLYRH